MKTDRFYNLAENILMMYCGFSQGWGDDLPDVQMPQKVIRLSADVIERGYKKGGLTHGKHGELFYPNMAQDYCMYYENYFSIFRHAQVGVEKNISGMFCWPITGTLKKAATNGST